MKRLPQKGMEYLNNGIQGFLPSLLQRDRRTAFPVADTQSLSKKLQSSLPWVLSKQDGCHLWMGALLCSAEKTMGVTLASRAEKAKRRLSVFSLIGIWTYLFVGGAVVWSGSSFWISGQHTSSCANHQFCAMLRTIYLQNIISILQKTVKCSIDKNSLVR